MNSQPSIALLGDYNPDSKAHQSIPVALTLSQQNLDIECKSTWVNSEQLPAEPAALLRDFDGLWCVPGSPYANTPGVLDAIRYARTSGIPFLGTCGGFQHALLEYAQTVWGIADPQNAETHPEAEHPIIAPLECSMVDKEGDIRFAEGSSLAEIYGAGEIQETYRCRYGLNPAYAARLESGQLMVAGRDPDGDVRAIELQGHPFFVGTLFQPERSAASGKPHPLVTAFVRAVDRYAHNREAPSA